MKKVALVACGLAMVALFAFGSSSAEARSSWSIGINTGPYWGPGYWRPAYVVPPPPPPVYYHRPCGYRPYSYAPVGLSFSYYRR